MSTVELFAVGDVYLDRSDPTEPWDDLAPELPRADLTLCNYEGPISDRGAVQPGRAGPPRTPALLAEPISRGWSAVSLAQNHVLDYGEVAALDTPELCRDHGLASAGLGRDLDEAWQPVRLDVGGVALSMLSIACAFPRSYAATETRCGVAAVHVNTTFVVPTEETEHPGALPVVVTTCHPADVTRLVWDADRAETSVVVR